MFLRTSSLTEATNLRFFPRLVAIYPAICVMAIITPKVFILTNTLANLSANPAYAKATVTKPSNNNIKCRTTNLLDCYAEV